MKNTKKLIAGITLGVMLMGAAAFAITPAEAYRGNHNGGHAGMGGPGYKCNYADMTEAQRADFQARHDQMMQWRKADLKAAVEAGRITQTEADARITLMQEHFQAMKDGKMGQGYRGFGPSYKDMTDAQKADFKARHEQMMAWHKKDLQAAVAAGNLTQKQADERIERMNARFKDMENGQIGMHNGYGHSSKKGDHNYRGGHYKGDGHNNDNCPYYK